MPASPSLRCSTGREPKLDTKHKRGHSFEGGLLSKAKDDDELILFNEMQMKEGDNFLLHSNEDLDDTLSKLKCFSDFKFGKKVPVRGESDDLLNSDVEKNDYDWLLTPPDTPLFPSLDDDEPPSKLVTRSRQSQPLSISKSSMHDRNQRPNRTSASPHRRSPSPRPGGNTLQSRGRASSVPRPSPILQSTTPSRRPCTPPPKSSTSAPRSVTPTHGRISSGLTSSSGRRGTSPMNGRRGNSASPKLRRWQSNAPGFSSDAPPNLRTSISGRATSYSRGSSPSSRNAIETPRHNRQSMSPTASGSISSSHSHDCDCSSNCHKGSIMSSGDDDIASLESSNVGIPANPTGKKSGMFVNGRTMAFPKKTSRTPSPSSGPRRSFDSALRQMDQRKTPQNMFRPLMSSVPPSSFYGGKAGVLHHPIFSPNPSPTTCTDACVASNTDCSDHDYADHTGEWAKTREYGLQEEIFIFDRMKEIKEDTKHECCIKQSSIDNGIDGGTDKMLQSENKYSISDLHETVIPSISLDSPYTAPCHVVADSCERMTTCSICGKSFQIAEVSGNATVCLDCAVNDHLCNVILNSGTQFICQEEDTQNKMNDAVGSFCDKQQSKSNVFKFPEETGSDADLPFQHVCKSEPINGTPQEDHVVQLTMARKEENIGKQSDLQWTIESTQSIIDYKYQHSKSFTPSSRTDGDEGTGISVPSRRSSSSEGHVSKGRTFSASNIQYPEPSYARENLSANRLNNSHNSSTASSSIDFGSSKGSVVQGRIFASANAQCPETSYTLGNLSTIKSSHSRNSSTASSSLDLGSSRQMKAHFRQQLSLRKGTADTLRNDLSSHTQDSLNSSTCETSLEVPVQNHESKGHIDLADFCESGEVPCCRTEFIHCRDAPSLSTETIGTEDNSCTKSIMDDHISESSDFSQSSLSHVADSSLADVQISNGSIMHGSSDRNQTKERNATDTEGPLDMSYNTGKEGESGVVDSREYSGEMPVEHEAHVVDSSLAAVQISDSSIMHGSSDLNQTKERNATDTGGPLDISYDTSKGSESGVVDSREYETSGEMLVEHDALDMMKNSQLEHQNSQSSSDDRETSGFPSVTLITDEVQVASQPEPNLENHPEGIHEKSTVTVETSRGRKSRSLTLEEATDTILFCSSIIHDLAYKAATIGIEKEQSSIPDPDVSRPIATVLEKPVSYQSSHGKTFTRRTNNPQSVRKKLETTDVKVEPNQPINDVKVEKLHDSNHPQKSEHTQPSKVEPKCKCTVM